MATASLEHYVDYDLVVAIDTFEDLTDGQPGWEVKCPQIERAAMAASTGQGEEVHSEPKGAAAVAAGLHQELQRRKLITGGGSRSISFGVAAENMKATSESNKGATENEQSHKILNSSSIDTTDKSTRETVALDYQSEDLATIFVAVVGLYNKGKTYVLNRIGKTQLPEGSGYHTMGISMKTGHGDILSRFTLLDIAGFDAPVRVGSDQNSVVYKKYVDRFIEELVLDLATAVIVVMNDITLADQLYLQNVREIMHSYKRKYAAGHSTTEKMSEKFSDLIVIHNFSANANLQECERAFRDQIEQNYNGKWVSYGKHQRFYYTDDIPGHMVGMRHMFIGRTLTEAERSHHATRHAAAEGDMYQAMIRHNVQVFEMIKTWMKGVGNESKVEPISAMVKVANTVLKSYFQNPPTARLHVKEGKAYIGFDAIWEYDFKQRAMSVKTESKMPCVMLLPRLGMDATGSIRMGPGEAQEPPYDVVSTPNSVVIVMDRVVPLPKVDFIPQEKKCIIKGNVKEPTLYTREGSDIEVRQRFSGEFSLEVLMDSVLTHGEAVAINFREVRVDKEKNLLFVLFDKAQVSTQEQPSEGSLDDVL